MHIQPWSPDWVSDQITRFRRQSIQRVASKFEGEFAKTTFVLMLILLVCFYFFHRATRFNVDYFDFQIENQGSLMRLCHFYSIVMMLSLPVGYVYHFVGERRRLALLLTSSVLTIMTAFFFRNAEYFTEKATGCVYVIAEALFFVGLHWVLRKEKLRVRLLGLAFSVVMLSILSTWVMRFYPRFVNLWIFHPNRWVFIFSFLIFEEHYRQMKGLVPYEFLQRGLMPVNFMYPLPIRSSQLSRRERSLDLSFTAAVDMLLAMTGIGLLFLLNSQVRALNIFSEALLNYVRLFLLSYSAIVMPVALMRWFGFDLPDAYSLPLLAASPQDRWRRWNTYFYGWFQTMVFMPVFKKSRSLFISIITVFLFTLFFHLFRLNFYIFTFDPTILGSVAFFRILTFFMAHALAVYIGLKFVRYWPGGARKWGWLGVLVTWAMMLSIHLFRA